MHVDDRAFEGLIEESQDLHSDAMRETRASLDELVELGHEEHTEQRLVARGVMGGRALAVTGLGGALLVMMSRPAFAASTADVQMLQTATSIENLAVATYDTALTLPFVGSLPAAVKTFVTTTRSQHSDHAKAFNAAVQALGAKPQTEADPALLQVVNQAKPGLTGPGPLVDLAIKLEQGAAETYVAFTPEFADLNARKTTASIVGVEAQHVAVLNAVKALVTAGHPEFITLPPPIEKLPAAAGSVGFPDAFIKTDQARAADEGAVK
jgi:hypothetical protein